MARTRRAQRRKRRGWRWSAIWPSKRTRRRVWRALRGVPVAHQVIVGLVALVLVWFAVNWVYQVVRKPAELFFPVSGALMKTPTETWRRYEPSFRAHATAAMTPDFLAALAQVEGSGNPVARTYWRWQATLDPFEVYRPASSAVGMYQITDGTFVEAKRFCIHNHTVVEDGPWHAWRTCWFNSIYFRVIPTHAVEMTSAWLDRNIELILARRGIAAATLAQKQELGAIIHLCGAGAGNAHAARGFRLPPSLRCGDHDVAHYLARVRAMQRIFIGLMHGA